jgi:hypothetical protein
MLIQPLSFLTTGRTTPRLLKLGMYYQGGYVIYLNGNYPNQGGLIIAPAEISSAMTWPAIGGQATPTDQSYGAGFSNTQTAYGAGYTTNGIGTCWNYSNDGYTDWFMPSLTELTYMIINQSYIPYTLNALTYHSSSAFSANPGNQNMAVGKVEINTFPVNHSDAVGVLACRYITT